MKLADFDYYRKSNRLIRVNGDYFQDITPHSQHPLTAKALKSSFKEWADAEQDNGEWVFIASYNFTTENDLFMTMYNSFKGVADYRKPKQKRMKITPELIADIQKRILKGETVYSISKMLGVSAPTVAKYSKLELTHPTLQGISKQASTSLV